jgi:hypothetical protein
LQPVTKRSILIGLICVIFLCLITPYNDYYIGGTFAAGNHFPIGSFFLYIILVLIGFIAIGRWKPKYALKPAELITIWCMMIVASGIPSSGFIRYHLFMLVAPYYYATPENEWQDLFFRYLPDSLIIKNPKAVKYFYEALPSGESVPWGVWIKPILLWSGYVLMTYFVLICLSVILRKQWVEHERFSFPLVRLPVEMVENADEKTRLNDFLRNRALWIGAGLAFILHVINGLHAYIPKLPSIPLYFSLDPYLNDKPWVALRSTILMIYPSIIGFSYLLSLDVSFSFWFFYILYKVQSVIAYSAGFSASGWTLANRQEMGGYIALVIFVIWLARHHLLDIVKATFGLKKVDDSNEPLPYRWALIGFVGGTFAIAGMAYMAGMSFWLAIGVMIFFYIMAIVLTWMVVDGGFLFLLAIFRPSDYIMIGLGSSRFSPASHTILAFEKTLMFDLREFMMPHVMNSFKAADPFSLKRRHLLGTMGIAMVVGLITSYYSGLMTWYHVGGLNMGYWWDPEPFDRLSWFLNYPRDTNWLELSFVIMGMVVMSFLIFMRYQFLWWRVHPLGYAMTTSWAPYTIWFSIFLGWLAKSIILKVGGLRFYRQMRPFFLGIVLGESLIGGLWIVIGLFTKVGYRILPG